MVVVLGIAQTLTWASTYYLPAIIARPLAIELGLGPSLPYAAFSAALVVSALVGPAAGRWIDRVGGRGLLLGSNVVAAAGLTVLAVAQGPVVLAVGWTLLGLAMGIGLYDAAFAALVRWYGREARGPITGITLIAGFASTVGWPLSAYLMELYGWRGACLGWALLHLILGLPLHALLPQVGPPSLASSGHPAMDATPGPAPGLWEVAALATVFAAVWFIAAAMAAHLPALLLLAGLGPVAAVLAAAAVGPAQVVARIGEFTLLGRIHPLWSARLAALAHPLACLALCVGGPAAGLAFTVIHGGGNGVLTVAKGTLPLALFGPVGYGQRQGMLTVPARLAQAGAPALFALGMEWWGLGALGITAGAGMLAAVLLLVMRPRR